MDDIYKNIEEYNPSKKRKILIAFDDTIANMLSNKELNSTVTELYFRARKINIFLVFIRQSYFALPRNIRLNYTHFFFNENSKQRRTSTNCTESFRNNLLERIWILIMTTDNKSAIRY